MGYVIIGFIVTINILLKRAGIGIYKGATTAFNQRKRLFGNREIFYPVVRLRGNI
jgi:hypothetical protein